MLICMSQFQNDETYCKIPPEDIGGIFLNRRIDSFNKNRMSSK